VRIREHPAAAQASALCAASIGEVEGINPRSVRKALKTVVPGEGDGRRLSAGRCVVSTVREGSGPGRLRLNYPVPARSSLLSGPG
jgi:hypothetical protein